MNKDEIRSYLESHAFFSQLNDEIKSFLSGCAESAEIEKGGLLFKEGDKAESFYVIRRGRVTIQMPALFGPTLDVQTLGDDEVLGWSWLIAPYKWHFQTQAEEDTELLFFSAPAILEKCEQNPQFGYELFRKFAELMSVRLTVARQKMMDSWSPNGFA